MISLRRRVSIALLVGVAMAWSVQAGAQAPPPAIGFLNTASPGPFAVLLAAFRQGLQQGGYIEGRNLAIEYRWAEGQYNRLPALAADLVRRQVTVITATGGTPSALAAKAATATIPIVFLAGANPVGEGLVESFNHPGGNVTGISTYTEELAPKRLEVLRDLLPKARKIATLTNPQNTADIEMRDMGAAARAAGLQMLSLAASTEQDFEPAFSKAMQWGADALLVSADPFFNSRRTQLVAVAARYRLPTAYPWREYVEAGGLMSYGTSLPVLYRQVGVYVSRILKGEKPSDLPVQNPTTFDLAINIGTAKSLGLTVPPLVYARASEVIE